MCSAFDVEEDYLQSAHCHHQVTCYQVLCWYSMFVWENNKVLCWYFYVCVREQHEEKRGQSDSKNCRLPPSLWWKPAKVEDMGLALSKYLCNVSRESFSRSLPYLLWRFLFYLLYAMFGKLYGKICQEAFCNVCWKAFSQMFAMFVGKPFTKCLQCLSESF